MGSWLMGVALGVLTGGLLSIIGLPAVVLMVPWMGWAIPMAARSADGAMAAPYSLAAGSSTSSGTTRATWTVRTRRPSVASTVRRRPSTSTVSPTLGTPPT
jgi:hypothetical protein